MSSGQAGARLTGTTVGSYEIFASIGRGGMGEVYRARDTRLQRDVAIKALADHLVSDAKARARFMRESEIACQIVHPYVATVFDVVTRDEDLLLVMEYIDGRTLRDVLKLDHPGLEKVSRYGVEIAEALVAIHRAGLVHRDLKPSNVMITPDDHVKVMDFGVAQPARYVVDPDISTSVETLTEIAIGGGTPRYMSPEQLRGGAVDARSDQFSFGILLYEAITGNHPFARGTAVETASAIINDPPGGGTEPETLTGTGPLRSVVIRMLEKSPDRRYPSAEVALEHLRSAVETPSLPSIGPVLAASRARRLAVSAVVVATVALAAVFSVMLARHGGGSGDIAAPVTVTDPRPVMAVLPFEDETGDQVEGPRSEMLAALLAAELGESRHLRSLGHDRVLEIVGGPAADDGRPAQIDRVLRFARASYVVAGRLYRDGDSYFVALDLYEPGRPEPVESFRSAAARVSALPDLMAAQTLYALAPTLGIAGAAADITPRAAAGSEEAMLGYYRATTAARERRFADAIDQLERVIRDDPRNVEALTLLAKVLFQAGFEQRAGEAARKAERLADDQTGRLGQRARDRLEMVQAIVAGDLERRIELARARVREVQDDPEARSALAAALSENGAYDEALTLIESAIGIDPTDPNAHARHGQVLAGLRRWGPAYEALAEAERLYREMDSRAGLAFVFERTGHVLRQQGEYDRAQEMFRRSAEAFDAESLWMLAAYAQASIADIDLMRGDLHAARERYDAVLPVARRAGNYGLLVTILNHLGGQYFQSGAMDQAEPLLRQAVGEAEYLKNDDLLISPLLNLGVLLSYTGRYSEGRALTERARGLARSRNDLLRELLAGALVADNQYRLGEIDASATALRDLLDAAEAIPERGPRTIFISSALSTVLESRCDLAAALSAAERSVTIATELGHPLYIGESRVRRAEVLTLLGRYDGAEADLRAAEEIARKDDEHLQLVVAGVALVRGMADYQRGSWKDAERALTTARRVGERTFAQDIYVPSLSLSALAAVRRGESSRAAELARQGVDVARAGVVEQIQARIALAEALIGLGSLSEAAVEARRAFGEAKRSGLPLLAAHAGSILVALPLPHRPADVEEVGQDAKQSLMGCLDAVPPLDRPHVAERRDVRQIHERLGRFTPARPSS